MRRDFYQHIQLPPNYVIRHTLIDELGSSLLDVSNSKEKLLTTFYGMGGIGKTVMARALCDNPAIQKAFPDGILWGTLG
jgi:hypothetical protein